MIRRALLKALAIPGYQEPFASREMPMPHGWDTGGAQVTAACLSPDDRIGIVSLMDHTPGQRQFRDIGKLRDDVMGKRGLSDAEFAAHVESRHTPGERLGPLPEATAVAEARRYGAVLASHDDRTADQVAVSAAHGVRLAEFPTTPNAARACRDRGIAVMMGGPNLIRGGSHSGNVAADDLAEAGLLDILSSDCVPSSLLRAALMPGGSLGRPAARDRRRHPGPGAGGGTGGSRPACRGGAGRGDPREAAGNRLRRARRLGAGPAGFLKPRGARRLRAGGLPPRTCPTDPLPRRPPEREPAPGC
ncbi:alpha-D-ribose 1-methylphosphonate 5-phosphate C-P-lyase PhnJ [Paracoccus fontiphilus]|uniref:Alpha-D-ribose 1-methylphosphonate 5-phosphate C-P-lyase PhnJ n=1 Tax=Paracoccus fontiphilus TaxID=1815556 RepID=A0ABV7IFY1_9RHOB